jgi:IS30 family transposase
MPSWTAEEERDFRKLLKAGKSFREIGRLLGRSEAAVKNRFYANGQRQAADSEGSGSATEDGGRRC